MSRYHQVENVRIEENEICLVVDGKELRVEIASVSSTLNQASEEQKKIFEVSPSGYGIHWPSIDEDVSIDGLLGLLHMPSGVRKSA